MNSNIRKTIVILLAAALFGGCAEASRTVKGGAAGAGAGAVVGAIIGHQFGDRSKGAIIGAAIGGSAGALIGRYMDKQAEEMQRDIDGAKIERIGEGIKITFDSGILFKTSSFTLESAAKQNIEKLSVILTKYSDTNIVVQGHTDSSGPDDYNQTLSEKRAKSVADYTKKFGVAGPRFTVVGYGETEPSASNETPEGMRQNRRVEIAIFANDKLKKAAKEGRTL